MFLLFHAQRPDVLPLGDFGVRKGTGRAFAMRGAGKGGVLDEKRDRDALLAAHAPYAPFRSLSAYYMWRAADTEAYE